MDIFTPVLLEKVEPSSPMTSDEEAEFTYTELLQAQKSTQIRLTEQALKALATTESR